METFKVLMANNRQVGGSDARRDPDFFTRTEAGQEPHFLIIGCSDSRVPT
jgi:carbonic anhydrase